jgi:hypothetical protein
MNTRWGKTGLIALLFISLLPTIWSCKKNTAENGLLAFSTDTLTFDTVFTAPFSSVTKRFKVFNRSSETLIISEIRLLRLMGNQFKINVDGLSGEVFTQVEVLPEDSIYVFVEVKVDDPNSGLTPFVMGDDIRFVVDGQEQRVHVQAWGQRAHYHFGETLPSGLTVWSNDLPHVVVASDSIPGVYVPAGAQLQINPGCKVFVAARSALFVEGELNACAGNWADSIVFQGVRLESFYQNRPGQWFGIVFLRRDDGSGAGGGSLCHCVIEESSYGIYAGAGNSQNASFYQNTATRPDVRLDRCIVRHNLYNGLFGFNARIQAENALFYAAGEHLVKLGLGGDYDFQSCTFFNRGSSFLNHQDEVVLMSNFLSDGNNTLYPAPLDRADFTNCVVYGSLENEISFNRSEATPFQCHFRYCLLKNSADSVNVYATVTGGLFNQEPRFKDPEKDDYTPSDSTGYFSPLIDVAPSGPAGDLYSRARPVVKSGAGNPYDIGAIETP